MKIERSRVAAMNIQYKYFPLCKFLDDAVENGVKNVELWGAAPHFYFPDMTASEIRCVRTEIERRELKLICFTPEQCVYPINLASECEADRRRSRKFFEDSIRIAGELGTDKVLVTSGTGYFDDKNHDDAWSRTAEGLFELGELAAHYDITLALEVLRRDESNLVYNLPTLKKMLDTLSHPQIGGMIDTIPMALAGERPADYLEALGEKLIHVHFIDGAPRGHLAWGDGVLDMKQYLEDFERFEYSGYFSLEITDGRYFMDPTASVRQSVQRLWEVLPSSDF